MQRTSVLYALRIICGRPGKYLFWNLKAAATQHTKEYFHDTLKISLGSSEVTQILVHPVSPYTPINSPKERSFSVIFILRKSCMSLLSPLKWITFGFSKTNSGFGPKLSSVIISNGSAIL